MCFGDSMSAASTATVSVISYDIIREGDERDIKIR